MAKKAEHKPRSATEFDAQVGNRIREARIANGFSQEALGDRLSVSFQQIQKYEKGVNRVSGTGLVKLCDALGVDPNFMLGWDKKKVVKTAGTIRAESMRLAQVFDQLDPDIATSVMVFARAMINKGYGKEA